MRLPNMSGSEEDVNPRRVVRGFSEKEAPSGIVNDSQPHQMISFFHVIEGNKISNGLTNVKKLFKLRRKN